MNPSRVQQSDMFREIGAFKERIVGWLLVCGFAVTVICGFLCWMFSVAGIYRGTYTRKPLTNEITDAGAMNLVPLMIFGVAVGLLMMFAGIGYGLWTMSRQQKGTRRVVPNFRVLARYCYDRNQNLITAEWEVEAAEKPRFYVRGVMENGVVGEFETSIEVYFNAGEGMYGEAELQGQWLGRFVPYVGAPAQS
jgi:hypothetical protein